MEDAKINMRLNNIKNVEFVCGKAEEVLPKYLNNYNNVNDNNDSNYNNYNSNNIDENNSKICRLEFAVVNPPRKGCHENVLRELGKRNVLLLLLK